MAVGNGLAFELVSTSDEGLVKIDRIIKKL
jgi:hypothetical protein